MSVRVGIVSCVLVAVLSGVSLAGSQREYEIDPTHSTVIFHVLNKEVSFVYGRFNAFSGVVTVDDPDSPKELSVEATVKSKSLDTNSKKRDKHLKGKEFFSTKKFKEITFKSTKSEPTEDGKFALSGDLTLLGETRPVEMTLEITGTKKMGRGKYLLGGLATFTIKRSEWGMDKMLKGIADEVQVSVSFQAVRDIPPAG